MIFAETKIKNCYLIQLEPIMDQRGWFARTYCQNEFSQIGHIKPWVQINHSFTKYKGTLRGLHKQRTPFEEIKLIQCISGMVYDVIVDLRTHSPTFQSWISIELSKENKNMIYIPEGCAHGFQTLTDDVELFYHHSQFFNPEFESGIRYNDPILNIQWPLPITEISNRDRHHSLLPNSLN